MNKSTLYIKSLLVVSIVFLVLFIVACVPSTRVSWEVFELLSRDNEDIRTVSESVLVSGCIIPERKSIDCNAGTSNDLTFAIGGNIGIGGRGGEIAVAPGVEASLSVGQSSGESLEFPEAEPGFIYHYQVLKTYRVISGEVLARSSIGQTQPASFAFHASCSVQVANIQIKACPSTGVTPIGQQPSSDVTKITSGTPTSLPTLAYLEPPTTPTDNSDFAMLRYRMATCTFVDNSNQMSENYPCPPTISNRSKNIFVHAVLVNDQSETLYLSRVTAVLTRADGRQQPVGNPIYTMPVKLGPGENTPLVVSILPQLLEPGQDYRLQLAVCLQDGPCPDTEWQFIAGESYHFHVAPLG